MRNPVYFAVILIAAAAPLMQGGYGAGDARKEKLYQTFIAPCCWQENLTEHHSPAADQLRARIDAMLVAGRSNDEIKHVLVDEFGPRILALPEGRARVWLFWTPFAVGIAGFATLLFFLARLKSSPDSPSTFASQLPEDWDAEEHGQPGKS